MKYDAMGRHTIVVKLLCFRKCTIVSTSTLQARRCLNVMRLRTYEYSRVAAPPLAAAIFLKDAAAVLVNGMQQQQERQKHLYPITKQDTAYSIQHTASRF